MCFVFCLDTCLWTVRKTTKHIDLLPPKMQVQILFIYCSLIRSFNLFNFLKLFLQAPKKLVRYHDNQVVTTKGERYQLVKKNETDEMKKTYVNLKPARKYRFH